MSIYINHSYRIKRNSEYETIMKKLVQANLFDRYSEIIVISAVIGYINNEHKKIEKPARDGVQMDFFDNNDFNIMDLIAYSHTKEQSVLSIGNDEKYNIFESYANGGFPILIEMLDLYNNLENLDKDIIYMQTLTKFYNLVLDHENIYRKGI